LRITSNTFVKLNRVGHRLVLLLLVISTLGGLQSVRAETAADTLVIGMSTSILITLDPARAYEGEALVLIDQLYDKLVDLEMVDDRIEIVPEVAESWSVSGDGQVWTFHVREGMRFPSGREITAYDVEFSLRWAVALNSGSSWLLNELGLLPDTVAERIRALGERSIEIRLSEPFAPNLVLAILAFPMSSVVDRDVLERRGLQAGGEDDYLKRQSAGSGPYRLVHWQPNESVVLEANAEYWRGAPPIGRIVVQDIPDEAMQRVALERGEIDIAWNLSPRARQELKAQDRQDLRIVQIPAHGVQYLGMNTLEGPLADERVREAIRWAIDYEAIRNDVMLAEALPLQSFIPHGYLGHNPETPYQQDVEKAKALLAAAGYAEGFGVQLAIDGASATSQEIARILQHNLADAGITVELAPMASGALFEMYRERRHQMVLARWGVDYPDPDALAKPFADGSIQQIAWRNGWHDEEATRLTGAAMVESEKGSREALYRRLTELVMHKGPFAILFQPLNAWGVRNDVMGFETAAALGSMHVDLTKVQKRGGNQ